MRSLALAAALLAAGPASAHAFLKSAAPAVGSTVHQAPSEVVIEFTQPIEAGFSSIAVQDASGAPVSAGEARSDGDKAHLAVGLKPLSPGAYKVIWHATSVDTHKTEGTFTFTVAP
jgi:methionine-rich copper-binding protein CopC